MLAGVKREIERRGWLSKEWQKAESFKQEAAGSVQREKRYCSQSKDEAGLISKTVTVTLRRLCLKVSCT